MTVDTLTRQLIEMAGRHEIGAIIMTPPEMMKLIGDPAAKEHLSKGPEGSGWTFQNCPIYRSWEISGPAVVSREVLALLKRQNRSRFLDGVATEAPKREFWDLLF